VVTFDLEKFRHREWTPTGRAAGIDHRRIYDCRHTFATWAIEDGRLSLIHVAQVMGTSVRQIEDTYFRWLSRTDEPGADVSRRVRRERGSEWLRSTPTS